MEFTGREVLYPGGEGMRHHTVIFFWALAILLGGYLMLDSHDVSAAKSASFNVEKRFLYIQPGQTVFSIVKVLYPDQKDEWPAIIKQIVRKNPHAFVNKDASRIVIGERIQLPALKTSIKPLVGKNVIYKGSEAVGQVIQARGKSFAISSKKKRRDLGLGSEVYVGDRLYTGVNGFMRLSMIDDAKIDLRCNSEMLIEDYQLLRAGNRSVIYLIQGSLRKITGTIGKMAADVYEMKTPMATVGVRGTEYALRVLQAHGCDGSLDVNSDGLFVKVNKGAIDLKNKSGNQELIAGDAAHVTSEENDPQAIKVEGGVFDAAEENEVSWWWWLLGIVVIAAAV
ncbi:MAG: FecR family protein [Gammaproteobacteria bacterium]|nr:FecR family protein [Gammaproteobacteria bacterium]